MCKNIASSLGSADSHTSTIYSSNHSPQKDYNIIYGSNDNILEESFNQDKDDIYETKPKSHRSLEFLVQAEEEMQSIWKTQAKKATVKPIIQNLKQRTYHENSQNNTQNQNNQNEFEINMNQNNYYQETSTNYMTQSNFNQSIPERPSNPQPRVYVPNSNYQHNLENQCSSNEQNNFFEIQMPNLYNDAPQYYGQNYHQSLGCNQQDFQMFCNSYQEYYQQQQKLYSQYQSLDIQSQNGEQMYDLNQEGFQDNYYSSFQNQEANNFYNYKYTHTYQTTSYPYQQYQ